jgi:oxygen-dependent protoporphyrinogen oxidase
MRSIFAIEPDRSPRVDFLAVLALFKGANLAAFKRAMAFYADQLAKQLHVHLKCEVTAVEDRGDEVALTWRDAQSRERTEHVEGCVVAVPASNAVAIVQGLDAWRAGYMGRVRNGKLVVLNVGLARPPAGVRATYTMIPRSVHPFLGGVVCDHHKAPGRVPAGKGLLTLAPVNGWCEQHYDDHDDSLVEALLQALEPVMPAASSEVEFTQVARWRQQYSPVGHYRDLGRFRATCDAGDRRVQLAGDYHSSQNLSAATYSGERAARSLMAAIG